MLNLSNLKQINFKYGNEKKINMEYEHNMSEKTQIHQISQLKIVLRKVIDSHVQNMKT